MWARPLPVASMEFTWLDSNSWLIELNQTRILVDPWLVGSLVFGGAEWLFKAERTQARPLPDRVDLILLSQGLPDHAHPPTLGVLDRSIPVVASPRAAKICAGMGYQNVTALRHYEKVEVKNVTIEALPGAPVGANLRENAYILSHQIYYEPHGYHDQSLKAREKIEVVITPVIDLLLPLVGAVIRGRASTLELCQWLRPKVLLPTATGGDLKVEGILLKFLRAEGSPTEMAQALRQQGLDTIVADVKPWEPYAVHSG